MKNCSNADCAQVNPQPIECFYKKLNGIMTACKACQKRRVKKWQQSNQNAIMNYRENSTAYKNYIKNYGVTWRKENKARRQAYQMKRRLSKQQAVPPWLTLAQLSEMEQLYINRPVGYHVDHIVPIQGKDVFGLHVPWNLQYLPASDNIRKGNRYK